MSETIDLMTAEMKRLSYRLDCEERPEGEVFFAVVSLGEFTNQAQAEAIAFEMHQVITRAFLNAGAQQVVPN